MTLGFFSPGPEKEARLGEVIEGPTVAIIRTSEEVFKYIHF
jgi:hypothetical protein